MRMFSYSLSVIVAKAHNPTAPLRLERKSLRLKAHSKLQFLYEKKNFTKFPPKHPYQSVAQVAAGRSHYDVVIGRICRRLQPALRWQMGV